MLWRIPIPGKSAEEVYSKFVEHFLLEEGAPLFILTDRGKEFDNELLRELLRLLKIRLYLTPSYHPRGNYAARVKRFVGESLRTMLNMPGAKDTDQVCAVRLPADVDPRYQFVTVHGGAWEAAVSKHGARATRVRRHISDCTTTIGVYEGAQ